jgi:hypothetical protein
VRDLQNSRRVQQAPGTVIPVSLMAHVGFPCGSEMSENGSSSSNQYAPTSLLVQSVVRAKRVAFLFDEAKVTLEDVDSVILTASEHWGGAFWPLVPFRDDGIAPEWWAVLEALDADIVYCLHELPPTILDKRDFSRRPWSGQSSPD